MAKSNIGHIAPFTKEKDNFENYVEKVQLFFLANNVQEGRKVPALLTLLEGETYELLKGLVAPTPPAELMFDAICNALKRHLCPAPRVIPERAKFFKRLQSEHETVADYNAALRKLASTCKFQNLEEMLRDRLVSGLRSTPNAGARPRTLLHRRQHHLRQSA